MKPPPVAFRERTHCEAVHPHTPGGVTMAVRKKAARKKAAGRKAASKRELIAPRGSKRYVRRDAKGRIRESVDVGRSLSADRRRKTRTVARPGQGDRGDRRK